MLKLYNELATWWPLLSPPEDYADEATFFEQVLSEAGLPLSPLIGPFAQSDQQPVSTGVLRQALDLSPSIFKHSKEGTHEYLSRFLSHHTRRSPDLGDANAGSSEKHCVVHGL